MLSLLLAGCSGALPEDTAAIGAVDFVAMTFNAGTTVGLDHDGDDNGYSQQMADVADELYENSLSWQPAEEALAAFLAAEAPELVVFQELFYDGWCEDIEVDPSLDFVCEGYTPDRPLQIERLLGEDYQIACAPGQEDNCAGVRRDFGRFVGCPDDSVCMEGLDGLDAPSGCSRGARVGRVHVETLDGEALTLVNIHASSGISGEDRACRVDQIRQVFVDRGDGQPAADGAINLVMGDINTDPFRLAETDESAAEWAAHVGEGQAYRYISAASADEGPPSYQGFASIDHIASDVLRRGAAGCSVEAVWEGIYWDHLPVRCAVSGLGR